MHGNVILKKDGAPGGGGKGGGGQEEGGNGAGAEAQEGNLQTKIDAVKKIIKLI